MRVISINTIIVLGNIISPRLWMLNVLIESMRKGELQRNNYSTSKRAKNTMQHVTHLSLALGEINGVRDFQGAFPATIRKGGAGARLPQSL